MWRETGLVLPSQQPSRCYVEIGAPSSLAYTARGKIILKRRSPHQGERFAFYRHHIVLSIGRFSAGAVSLIVLSTWLGSTEKEFQMPHLIAIVSDCGGQAMSRMMTRYMAIHPDAVCVPYESRSLLEAAGNIVDAIDALNGRAGAIVCNSAPRRDTRGTNGSAIVYLQLGQTTIVSTVGALGLLKQLMPEMTARAVDVDAFMSDLGAERDTFNFRGLEVIPWILRRLRDGENLENVSSQQTAFPAVEPCVWLVDTICGEPTNLKLSVLRSEAPWFKPGTEVEMRLGGASPKGIGCFERLTHVPAGQLGIYEGSSGLDNERFLEIAVMGGSAAKVLGVPELFYTNHPRFAVVSQ